MKKIKYILIAFLMVVSCNILEIPPQDVVAPSEYYTNEKELETALTGIYSTLSNGALYKSHMIGRMGLDADQAYDNRDGDVGTVSQYMASAADVKVERFWKELYRGINNANFLIKSIAVKKIEMDQQEKDRILGEALFLRAYYYFLLVSNYGDVPLLLEPNNSAKPEVINVKRTDSKKVYDQIIADMTKAADMVSGIDELGFGGRVSKSAVLGILARVHLFYAGEPLNQKEHYAMARDCAKQVMDLNIHSLNENFQQVFINYGQDIYDIKESIWEVEFKGNGVGLYARLGGYIGGNNGIRNGSEKNGIGYTYDYMNVTQAAYDVYEDGDVRRDYSIAPFRYDWAHDGDKVYWEDEQVFNRNCGKFRREYEILTPKHRSYTPTNFPLLRYSDVLLMFAEADNEVKTGPSAEAYEAVNKVVRRGYGKDQNTPDPSIDWSGMDYESFKAEIVNERSRELAFESLRKGDLVRWGIFLEKMKDCLADANKAQNFGDLKHAKAAFSNVSERDVLFPIPSYEIALNPNLTQNPGW